MSTWKNAHLSQTRPHGQDRTLTIHPTIYYKSLKDFIEPGKGRLRGDTKREATTEEVRQAREENERLKQLVAELSLANLTLKKSWSCP